MSAIPNHVACKDCGGLIADKYTPMGWGGKYCYCNLMKTDGVASNLPPPKVPDSLKVMFPQRGSYEP
jgi:hypothetical protein